ncbi:MAG: hydroxymethylpyrimidine/phosphomethylpyrimidine kinase, partial [Planctomycetes bacterium]|nr:hydroxymethylpyrimidine/phosphomethylpyrimidine kinase [Planctomycetota bacterium]
QVLPVFPSVVLGQLQTLLRDIRPAAIKLGMLASDDVTRQVALGLELLEGSVPIVIDPVLWSSDGSALLERRAWGSLELLMGRAAIVTPNLPEAEALSGSDVSTEEGVEAAASGLVVNFGAGAVLVTGGHRDGPPDDLLAVREGGGVVFHWLKGKRVGGTPVHGTGCALASAITAGLAQGEPLRPAVDAARRFVASALARAEGRGKRARFLVYG